MKISYSLFIIGLGLLPLSAVRAETLSKEALYVRCYSQVTGVRPLESDANLPALRAGTGDPITACLKIVDEATLVSNGTSLQ
ncbi:MAG: hypothetical protein EOP06_29640, partial [Proteobacteria bacterium]